MRKCVWMTCGCYYTIHFNVFLYILIARKDTLCFIYILHGSDRKYFFITKVLTFIEKSLGLNLSFVIHALEETTLPSQVQGQQSIVLYLWGFIYYKYCIL